MKSKPREKNLYMETEKDETISACPYFSERMKTCRLSRNGIYLPPKVHMLTYCMTPKYTECSIYQQFISMEAEGGHSASEREANRRRFKRIYEQRKVLIRTCSPEGIVVGDFAEMASTLDYSQKGMRVLIRKEVPEESLLLFDFDNDFLIPRLQGFAQLRWHRKCPDSPQDIEAGLVFKDEYSQKVLSLVMSDS